MPIGSLRLTIDSIVPRTRYRTQRTRPAIDSYEIHANGC